MEQTKEIKPVKTTYICSFCGKEGTSRKVWTPSDIGVPLCDKHIAQHRKHGKCFAHTYKDKNKIEIKGNHAEIIILNRKNEEKDRVLIDIEDISQVQDYVWGLSGREGNRPCAKINGKSTLLYNLIMNNDLSNETFVDHIDRNPLNNRKSNLRICTRAENNRNTTQSAKEDVGVTWHKTKKKWRARINHNKKEIHLGMFDTKEEALKVRKEVEEKLFGEFAPLERRGINNDNN